MTDDHLSLDELAELDEGLLDPQRESAARAHLDACAQCRARAGQIAATRSLLGDLPPVPMPADVRARLDRVIAEEAARADGETAPDSVVPNVIELPRRRFAHPTMAASAAAAAFVLVISAIVVAHLHGSSSTGDEAGAGNASSFGALAPSTSTGAYPVSKTGRNYTATSLPRSISKLLSTNATAPAAGPLALPSPAASSTKASGGLVSRPSGSPTGHGHKGTAYSREAAALPRSLVSLYNSQPKLLRCALLVSPAVNLLPIAVDFARWSGGPYHRAPSIIFVYSGTINGTVRVMVVGPACNTGSIYQFTQVTLPN